MAGLDEAGRGPWAGPVVAAAVLFDREALDTKAVARLRGLTDSKQLSPDRREHYFAILRDMPGVTIAIGWAEPKEIDELNVLKATYLAMRRALEALEIRPDHALVDGPWVPDLPCAVTPVIRGDSRCLSIAAASVVAKVARDHRMLELDKLYPGYGFARNKGYGTPQHREALARLGPSPCHRHSFLPVRQMELPLTR